MDEQIPIALRGYMDMWNERDESTIADHVARVFTEDAEFCDPLHHVTGHAAIAAMVVGTRQIAPESQYRLASKLDRHHDRVRYHWHADLGDGNELPGFDVTVLAADGRIARVDGFFNLLDRDD